jgi:hypothetical protein
MIFLGDGWTELFAMRSSSRLIPWVAWFILYAIKIYQDAMPHF